MSTKKNKLPTLIHFILDRSGSMESCKDATISGFNEYINGLQKTNKGRKLLFSLTTFDSFSTDVVYEKTLIEKVKKLTNQTFEPRGGTPLYDAVVNTIEKSAPSVKKNQPALVVIMTDGEENSSHEHNQDCLKDLVEQLQKRGNWTFVFLGANQNAWLNAGNYGMNLGNSSSWKSTSLGTSNAFRGLAAATINYCAAVNEPNAQLNTSNFFNNNGKGGDVNASLSS